MDIEAQAALALPINMPPKKSEAAFLDDVSAIRPWATANLTSLRGRAGRGFKARLRARASHEERKTYNWHSKHQDVASAYPQIAALLSELDALVDDPPQARQRAARRARCPPGAAPPLARRRPCSQASSGPTRPVRSCRLVVVSSGRLMSRGGWRGEMEETPRLCERLSSVSRKASRGPQMAKGKTR